MIDFINFALTVAVATGLTWFGILMLAPTRPGKQVSTARKVLAAFAFVEAANVLFLQWFRPSFAQTVALAAFAGFIWLLDLVTVRSFVQRGEVR